jgi:excisionase family DNA binding protein
MQHHDHKPKLAYSIREACEATSLSRTTIFSHIAARRLHVVRIGGRTLIPADSLRSFLKGEKGQ